MLYLQRGRPSGSSRGLNPFFFFFAAAAAVVCSLLLKLLIHIGLPNSILS